MEGYGSGWNKPEELLRLRKLKTKKRALQDRLFDESPSKKSRTSHKAKRLFAAQPPPPDEATCEDSTLMEIIGMKHSVTSLATPLTTFTGDRTPTSGLSTSLSASPTSSLSMSPRCNSSGQSTNSLGKTVTSNGHYSSLASPMKAYLPSLSCFSPSMLSTPTSVERKRQRITPAPPVTSPSWATVGQASASRSTRRGLNLSNVEEEAQSGDVWHDSLCMDWSVKTRLLVTSKTPFGWSTGLKASEESSGISAFVRCIDMEPSNGKNCSPPGSQLDTSLGAQFHQCCLYWQHPYLPTVKLFPREAVHGITSLNSSSSAYAGNIKLEERALDTMFLEWVDSFRSIFQLLRTIQCPYFYVFGNQLTCLFTAAGTQGLECLQIYVTPSPRGFREALKKEGIDFTLPYYEPTPEPEEKQVNKSESAGKDAEVDSDDEPDKWLDEMGISQDLSVSMTLKSSPTNAAEEKGKSSLLMITGESCLAFFNFLINSRNLLISHSGAQAGLPPTIIAPVAFQGASLRTLTAKQSRSRTTGSDKLFTMELIGPILPLTVHMLVALLTKTVKNFEMSVDTMTSTKPVNVNRQTNSPKAKQTKPNAFGMQNLSDCGTKSSLIEVLCRSDIIDTLLTRLECQNLKYRWS